MKGEGSLILAQRGADPLGPASPVSPDSDVAKSYDCGREFWKIDIKVSK